MKVSVIIPFHNEACALPRCLDSVLAQAYPEMEIILVDDGSTDGSGDICKKYAQRDPRIRLVQGERVGPGQTRNIGLDAATGGYIQFVDADDYILPGMTAALVTLMESKNANLVECGAEKLILGGDSDSTRLPVCTSLQGDVLMGEYLASFSSRYDITSLCAIWNKLYRRELIEKHSIRFERELLQGQDVNFNAAYFRACESISIIPDQYYVYVVGTNAGTLTSENKYFPKKLWYRYSNYLELTKTANQYLSGDALHAFEGMLGNFLVGAVVSHCRRDATLTDAEILADLQKLPESPGVREWLRSCRPQPGQSRLLPLLLRLGWIRPLFYLARRRADKRFGGVYGLSEVHRKAASHGGAS